LLSVCLGRQVPRADQLLLWFSGLRGAVSFALVLSFPSPHRRALIATTAWTVLTTVLVFGGSTPLLLRRLQPLRSIGAENATSAAAAGGADGLEHTRLDDEADGDATEFDQPATDSRLMQVLAQDSLTWDTAILTRRCLPSSENRSSPV
jgi:NhaP-type Na+/H+ or K+/H+ antiporter